MKTVPLGSLVDRKIGYGIVQPGNSDGAGVPVIKVNNLISGLHSVRELDTTSREIDAKYSRTKLQGGELIVSVVGTIGRTAIVPSEFAGCNLVRATALVDIKDPIIARWVKYYIDSPSGQQYIQENLNTTVQPTLNVKSLVDMPIPIPEETIMSKSISILDAIDRRIENNRLICENVLNQAKALFSRFFIDQNGVPVGWRQGCLLDIADYVNGLAMQKYRPAGDEEGLPVLKIKELRQGYCDSNSERCSSQIKPDYIVHDGDVVFSWSGSLLVDFWCGGKCGLNQHLFKVTSSVYDKWFYYAWTDFHLDRFIAIAADKATTMGHIKREELSKAEVLIPSADYYDAIGGIMRPLYDLIIQSRIENRNLAILRDALLPRLMVGDIDVGDVEI